MSDGTGITLIVGPPDSARIQFVAEQGPPGPPGPAGPPGGVYYLHTQVSPAAEWLINHNLGFQPTVAVVDTGGNELDAAVQHLSVNQVRIYFVTTMAGFARLI